MNTDFHIACMIQHLDDFTRHVRALPWHFIGCKAFGILADAVSDYLKTEFPNCK